MTDPAVSDAVEIAAACAGWGIPVDWDRLFYRHDPLYRVIVLAVVRRAHEIEKRE